MNKRNVLIANLNCDPAPASPRLRQAIFLIGPGNFLNSIFSGIQVTFSFWRTYFVVKPALNGESVPAARRLLEKQSDCNVAGEGMNDEQA